MKKKKTPKNTTADAFEIKHTGEVNYLVEGGGKEFWADGIREKTILEAKFVIDPKRSTVIPGSNVPEFIRAKITSELESEFERMSVIIKDMNNPLTSVEVIVSDARAIPFFTKMLAKYKIPGKVIIGD